MWYTANIFFEGKHDVVPVVPSLWEESIVLIEAEDEVEAQALAEHIGRSREHAYEVDVPSRHILGWTLAVVERVCGIDGEQPRHGTELFTRFLRAPEAC